MRSVCLLLCSILTLPAVSCAASTDHLSDAAKRARIQEMYDGYRASFVEVQGISAEEVMRRRDTEDVLFIDVRSAKERRISRIRNSVTPEELPKDPTELREELGDRLVVAYCTVGYRSGKYAEKLQNQGIEILNLEGSLLSWTHAGGELVDDAGPTDKLHVYGKRWNLAPQGIETTW
ncbi:MAG: rhodanese-like domain-containing protein [Acidobacteriota bacterium]